MATRRIEIGKGGIDVMSAIVDLPRSPDWAKTPEARAQLLEEEVVLQDDLVAYGYHFGANDLEKTLEHFSDDVVLKTPGGTLTGSYLVRKNYEYLLSTGGNSRHIWGSVAIRFADTPDEAYRTAIIHEMWRGFGATFRDVIAVSTDIHRLKKINGRWKIVERCIVPDADYKVEEYKGLEEGDQEERGALIAQWEREAEALRQGNNGDADKAKGTR